MEEYYTTTSPELISLCIRLDLKDPSGKHYALLSHPFMKVIDGHYFGFDTLPSNNSLIKLSIAQFKEKLSNHYKK